jgi:glutathione S-transferase
MEHARIAVVRGASNATIQEIFQSLADEWSRSARVAGVLAEHHGLADRACSAGFLRSILTGERFPIFQDLGPGSTTCHLDGGAMLSATEAVQRDIAAGCDLVLLNKFGKLEAANSGLADAPLNTTSASYRAVNPNGLVPAIDDDGFVLTESFAITLYLARKYGGPLAPRDAREDGLMTMWTLWAATGCEGSALQAMQNAASVKTRDAVVYDRAVADLEPKFAVLDAALRDGDGFLVGGRFTVADLNAAEVVRYAQDARELFGGRPHVQAWITACQSRPAFIAMMTERNAEPV